MLNLLTEGPAWGQQQPKPSIPAAVLPGGSSSLQENFEDWSVVCGGAAAGPICNLVQVQTDSQNQQRILAVELKAPAADGVTGTIALPFGLAVAKGVTMQFDEGASSAVFPFKTCVPAGCLVSVSFSGASLNSMKQAKALVINGFSAENDAPVRLSVSLKGFSSAFNRTVALGADLKKQK